MVEILPSQRYKQWYGALPETAAAQDLAELGLFARQFGRELLAFGTDAVRQMRELLLGMPHGVLELWQQLLEAQAAGELRQKFGKPKDELVGAGFVAANLTNAAEKEVGILGSLRADLLASYERFQQVLMQQLAVKLAELAEVQNRLQQNQKALQTAAKPTHTLAMQEFAEVKSRGTNIVSKDQAHYQRLQQEITVLEQAVGSFLSPLGVALQQLRQFLVVAPLDASKAVPV